MKAIHLKTVVFAAVVAGLTIQRASAQLVVDQVADAFNATSPSGELGGPSVADFQSVLQTFTVGVGGTLAGVELQAQQGEGSFPGDLPTGDLIVSILGTTGGLPDFTQNLGSVSLPVSSIPAFDAFTSGPFTAFDVSVLGIAVAPGDVLAIEVSSPTDTGSYFVYDAEVDIYDGGTSFTFGEFDGFFVETSPRDLGFRTTVLIPEPSSLALLGVGGLLLKWRRRFQTY